MLSIFSAGFSKCARPPRQGSECGPSSSFNRPSVQGFGAFLGGDDRATAPSASARSFCAFAPVSRSRIALPRPRPSARACLLLTDAGYHPLRPRSVAGSGPVILVAVGGGHARELCGHAPPGFGPGCGRGNRFVASAWASSTRLAAIANSDCLFWPAM